MKRGFTLIELVVVIAVIGILASISLVALSSAAETAKERRTQALIRKLDSAIMARWDSYRTRRVGLTSTVTTNGPASAALLRLWAMRELMRYEMPQKWTDVDINFASSTPKYLAAYPSLLRSYSRRYNGAKATLLGKGMTAADADKLLARFQDAECLYMTVSMANEEDAWTMDHFRGSDTGDKDGDGLPEFLDGWGNPIRWLRWAPGYVSDLQPAILPGPDGNYFTADDIQVTSQATLPPYERDQENAHDPFDPLKRDMPNIANGEPRRVIKLHPLIFSAGPDEQWDSAAVAPPQPLPATYEWNDPYEVPSGPLAGGPSDVDPLDGTLGNLDNITNHQMGQWVR